MQALQQPELERPVADRETLQFVAPVAVPVAPPAWASSADNAAKAVASAVAETGDELLELLMARRAARKAPVCTGLSSSVSQACINAVASEGLRSCPIRSCSSRADQDGDTEDMATILGRKKPGCVARRAG